MFQVAMIDTSAGVVLPGVVVAAPVWLAGARR
jgi:hypothetical protein